ncbi:hypothetical protein IV102_21470 [bacterium]|nr:hypothetical protein [bacterium]
MTCWKLGLVWMLTATRTENGGVAGASRSFVVSPRLSLWRLPLLCAQTRWIHLATHGQLDGNNPTQS